METDREREGDLEIDLGERIGLLHSVGLVFAACGFCW